MKISLSRLETRTYNITAEELYKILEKYYETLVPYGCRLHLEGDRAVIRDSYERSSCTKAQYEMLEALNSFLNHFKTEVEHEKKKTFLNGIRRISLNTFKKSICADMVLNTSRLASGR